MSQQPTNNQKKRALSLSAYISLLLALTAIIPLLATVISLETFLRPQLINQVNTSLERDAQTQVQLIDAYLTERLNEVQTLSQSTPVRSFMAGDKTFQARTFEALFNSQHRDVANYISWSLITPNNQIALSYPTAPDTHGKYLILPENVQQLKTLNNVSISPVFYDSVNNQASIDLYARVLDNNFQLLGYVRASLGLRRVWAPVDQETQANGAGSYGFILDQNGVRIAYTNTDLSQVRRPPYLMRAVAPLSSAQKQQINSENLYGNATQPLTTFKDNNLASAQNQRNAAPTFQFNPAEQQQAFAAARYRSTIVPWTYYVVKPLGSVTGLANQQLLSTLLIALLFLILAIAIGLFTGRRITAPILRSVSSLRKNTLELKELAEEEHRVVNEQTWMVEASQIGMNSVKYYTNATNIASERIISLCTDLLQNPIRHDPQKILQTTRAVLDAATYVQKATRQQGQMNEKMMTTLRVTDQVTNQLTKSASSSDASARGLEQIVNQLTSVVGE
jgi:methyl-accepting chemotaxis protein